MNFYPSNRHLLVKKNDTPEESSPSAVLLPEDYKPKTETYGVYTIVAEAPDCSIVDVEVGDTVVVEQSMVKEISHNKEKFFLVQENYVLGAIAEE